MAARSDIGAGLVRAWACEYLPRSGAILDIGCGSGIPITQALVESGFTLFGIDASPTLIDMFRRRFPDMQSACEPAQDSAFFSRTFDGVVAVGLLFLLSADDQRKVLRRIAGALKPGGRLLFSAPREECEWQDVLTGRRSVSLGERAYGRIIAGSGLSLAGCLVDEGENNYFDVGKPPSQ